MMIAYTFVLILGAKAYLCPTEFSCLRAAQSYWQQHHGEHPVCMPVSGVTR